MDNIIFSFDIDWAPEYMLEYLYTLIEEHDLKATIFATHESFITKGIAKEIEIGIHPNFLNKPFNEHSQIIDELLEIYPNAVGIRNHGLFEYSSLWNIAYEKGLKYDSNQLINKGRNLEPYNHDSGLVRIPFYWEDDDNYLACKNWTIEEEQLKLPGIKIFNFHPVHLFLNTESIDRYNTYKKVKNDRIRVRELINSSNDIGTAVFFNSLVRYIKTNTRNNIELRDVYKNFVQSNIEQNS